MNTYLCVQCNERFDSDERRPRCPRCLRIHGVTTVDTAFRPAWAGKRRWWALSAVFLVAAGLGLWLQQAQPAPPAEGAPRVADVEAALKPLDEDAQALARALVADAALSDWARRVATGDDPLSRARTVRTALASGTDVGFVRLPLWEPRESAPLTAAAAFEAMGEPERPRLYPIEASAVLVAGLRAAGVPAMVAEIAAYPDESAPLDPSGCIGYFGVAIPRTGELPQVLDPYGPDRGQPAASDFTVLEDRQVVAALLGIRAWTTLEFPGDAVLSPKAALREVDVALDLWPRSPTLRSVRAVALAANGGLAEGEAAARAAAQLRGDAARLHNLAAYLLEQGDVEGAEKHLSQALALRPEFPSARVSLARMHMARGQGAEAEQALAEAEAEAPDVPGLALAYAYYYAAEGDLERAIERGQQAVAERPERPRRRLSLAQLYQAAGRVGDMQRSAQEALSLTPPGRKAELRELIGAILGPSALASDGPGPKPGASGRAAGARAGSDSPEPEGLAGSGSRTADP